MGFSLEPNQEAYETALKADYTEQLADLTDENAIALRDAGAKYFTGKDAQEKLNAEFVKLTKEQQENPEVDRVLLTFTQFLGNNAGVIEKFQSAVSFSTILFWAMATLVGTVQGGIQAVSRSYFGKLIPKERSNEFFGFFDIFGKFASVLGPVLYSTIGAWTGRSSFGVLALIALFLVGLGIMTAGRKELDALESGSKA
ncbi:MAG: MFS transporter [Clostridia bacterium]|nr:MFS transporter [Clostridia bacterium]